MSVDEFFEENENAQKKPQPASDGSAIIAQHLAGELAGLFAGGKLSDADKDAVMHSLERAYWLSHPDEKPQP